MIDGFSLQAGLRAWPNRYFDFAVGQLEALRNAGGGRCRRLATPNQRGADATADVPMVANQTLDSYLNPVPGSYIWAISVGTGVGNSFNAFSGAEVEIIETTTRETLWRSSQQAAALNMGLTDPANYLQIFFPVGFFLLVVPFRVAGPILVRLTFTSTADLSATDRQQVALHLWEPITEGGSI